LSRFAGSKVPARPSLELWNVSNGTKSAAKLITQIQTNRDSFARSYGERLPKRPSAAPEKKVCYLSYQFGGGSLERRVAKVEIIIAEFHHVDAPTT